MQVSSQLPVDVHSTRLLVIPIRNCHVPGSIEVLLRALVIPIRSCYAPGSIGVLLRMLLSAKRGSLLADTLDVLRTYRGHDILAD